MIHPGKRGAKNYDPDEPLVRVFHVQTEVIQPTQAQIDAIQPYLLRDFPVEELYVRQMRLANDQYDRSYERFDRGYLKRFAETIPGKSVMVGHDHGSAPVGRFFEACLAKDSNGWNWVRASFYMPRSAGNELARDSIDSGIWTYCSIGARVDLRGLICDICGQPYFGGFDWETAERAYCPHLMGDDYDGEVCRCTWDSKCSDMGRVEAVEGSIVYLGCQYEAAVSKSAEQSEGARAYKETLLLRGAVPSHSPPTADRGRSWDGSGAVSRIASWAGGPDKDDIDWGKYSKGFAWFDEEDRENFGSYKLPHHDIADGQLVTVLAGVHAAGAAIQGARGGVSIPEGDVAGVRAHLARHYRQFDETPPWQTEEDSAPAGVGKDNTMNELEKAQAELAAKTTECEALALERDALTAYIAELEPLAKEGEQYRADLRAEMIRIGGLIGMADTASMLAESLAETAKLKAVLEDWKRQWDEKRPPQGHSEIPTGADPTKEPVKSRDSRAHSII